tara:strand:- start:377 stop:1153 length:777 start_codon:yes stop_codon:yes gene_type:complete
MTNRMKYCIANFKMNKNRIECKEYIDNLYENIHNDGYYGNGNKIRMIICPPFHSLDACQDKVTTDAGLYFGSQNVSQYENGSYTGEISASMLNHIGSEYVIIGHSERRAHFNESNDTINKKIKISIENCLLPIFCIGETRDQREENLIKKTLTKQLSIGLSGVNNSNFVIAYEPVWAIGTGQTATSEIITATHKMIRNILNDIGFDGKKISILYGGSVNRSNAKELIALSDVDGFLIGGASLDIEHFYEIYKFIEEST